MVRAFLRLLLLPAGVLCLAAASNAAAATDPAALEAAVRDLIATFGDRYPNGRAYLARLDKLAKSKDAAALAALQREALLANPLVRGRPILFVTRPQYLNNHGTEATMCQTGEINTQFFRGGGAMKTIDLAAGGKVTALLEMPRGIVRDPEVSFDGRRIVFSMRRDINDDYHLYEMDLATRKVTQLTFAPRVSDIQPVYMPDGQIVFSSTREPKYIPCQRHLMCNLFTMNADPGAPGNIRQLGHNTQFEGGASLMPDGRILYTRWEYVDKHYASAYGLWAMNPDGTNQVLYYGGYAWQPGSIADARAVGEADRFVAVYTTVHALPWGAIAMADRRIGLDGLAPILRSWPADITPYMRVWDRVDRVGGGGFDSFMSMPMKYEDPYPLSEKHFLCSRSLDRIGRLKYHAKPPRAMALYLLDVFGNEVLLHAEDPGCFDPMPMGPRPRPPAIASRIDLARTDGTFYVQDVYVGAFMDRVKRGAVKSIRIVEAPPKLTYPPWGIGDWTPALNADGHHPVAVNWGHYNHKRVLGKVPVEPDGSAYFTAPADKFLYFQLLDENDMMIHSMRSGTTLQPGEDAGCTGCHEHQLSAPVDKGARPTLALRRPPSRIAPWYGPPRNFSYAAEVQPVLDKHCIRCHDHGKKAAKVDLCGDKGPAFNMSYATLKGRSPAVWTTPKPGQPKPLINAVDAGPIAVVPPYSWGSHASRLIDMLRKGHNKVRLDKESFDRIVTWIDLNTPYYPSHLTYYRTHLFGRCPLNPTQLRRLEQLVMSQPAGKKYRLTHAGAVSRLIMTEGPPINFGRLRLSRCLQVFQDPQSPQYTAALALIQTGKDALAAHPRLDMPGFRPCEFDQRRVDIHADRLRIEARNRQAILQGRKVHDRPPRAGIR